METVLFNRFRIPSQAEGENDIVSIAASESVLVEEEKNYQRLMNEKLKSAADWDIRDAKMFCIG